MLGLTANYRPRLYAWRFAAIMTNSHHLTFFLCCSQQRRIVGPLIGFVLLLRPRALDLRGHIVGVAAPILAILCIGQRADFLFNRNSFVGALFL